MVEDSRRSATITGFYSVFRQNHPKIAGSRKSSVHENTIIAQDINNLYSDFGFSGRLTKDKEVDFNLGFQVDTENGEQLMTRETLSSDKNEMMLAVEKPNYLGASKWNFRHGSKTISASIEDSGWLNDFENRKMDVRPGDSLRCRIRVEVKYGYENEVVNEGYFP